MLLISAGIGVTPVLAMLHQLAAARSAREVWWIHTRTTRPSHAFRRGGARPAPGDCRARESTIFYTRPAQPPAPAPASGRDGSRGACSPASACPPTRAAYVCGPAAFMADVRAALAGQRRRPARIHTELFGALGRRQPRRRRRPRRPAAPAARARAGTGPAVTFARSGSDGSLGRRDGSLLELADACDVPTRWSCRTGVCHTCVTAVLSGSLVYAPEPLERPEDGAALICCAQPTSDLVLDL